VTRVDELLAKLKLDTSEAMVTHLTEKAATFAFAQWLHGVIISLAPIITHDRVFGHVQFSWDNLPNDAALEILIVPATLEMLPHEHGENGKIDISVDAHQLFALAFTAVSDPNEVCELPQVTPDGKTSGPTMFANDRVFIKAMIPGLPDNA